MTITTDVLPRIIPTASKVISNPGTAGWKMRDIYYKRASRTQLGIKLVTSLVPIEVRYLEWHTIYIMLDAAASTPCPRVASLIAAVHTSRA